MEEEINFKEIFNVFWNRKLIIICITLIFAIFAYIKFNFLGTPKVDDEIKYYYSQASCVVTSKADENKSTNELSLAQVSTYTEIMKSKTVLENIIKNLNLNITSSELSDFVLFMQVSDSNAFKIIVAYPDKNLVIKISEELLKAFSENMARIYDSDYVSVIDVPYLIPENEVTPDIIKIFPTSLGFFLNYKSHVNRNIVLVSAVGFVLSIFVVFILEMYDDTVKNEKNLNDKILAVLDKNETNFDILREKISKNNMILVTTAKNNEEKNNVANNLAQAFEKIEKRTLLIDLSSKESNNNLDVLLKGSESTYLDKEKIQKNLEKLQEDYDYIIINENGILDNANTLLLSEIVRNVVLVVKERNTKLNKLKEAQSTIEEFDGNLLGNIMIKKKH